MHPLLPITLLLLLSACVHRPEPASYTSAPQTLTAAGDWDDLDAAVLAGGFKVEMGLVDVVADDPAKPRAFHLITSNDEPVLVLAARRGQAIDLEARVGHFGDSIRETALLAAIRDRLATLDDHDSAPIRGYP